MNNRYLLSRVSQSVFTIWIVVTLSFAMIRLMPGGPVDYIRSQYAQQLSQGGTSTQNWQEVTEYAKTVLNINPDAPLHVQYVNYMAGVFQGDFGQSVWYGEPVMQIIIDALPWTLLVLSIATVASFVIGIVLGALMAYYEGSKMDSTLTVVKTVTAAVPYYVYAVLFIGFFAYNLGWFPSGGRMDPNTTAGWNVPFLLGVLHYASLPILSLIIASFGGPALQMRGNSIQILGKDYLRVGRLRGLKEFTLATQYVARNAILPLYTSLLIRIAGIFGGAVILEQIFSYPGMGYYLIQAFRSRDYPLMMGGFIILTTATVIGVFIADLTYGLVDPRIEVGGEHELF
jgi:peptide/nickel transport system permease protein